jgi:hypothetical protein
MGINARVGFVPIDRQATLLRDRKTDELFEVLPFAEGAKTVRARRSGEQSFRVRRREKFLRGKQPVVVQFEWGGDWR